MNRMSHAEVLQACRADWGQVVQWIDELGFPKPIKGGQGGYWDRDEVERWLVDRLVLTAEVLCKIAAI